jgi:hypothetical protein
MIKGGKGRDGEDELSALIRDQLHDPANRKYLSRMAAFRVDSDTNEIFSDLLRRLDRADRAAAPR